MTIRIFVTGGTFDKEYDEIGGRLFFKETHVPEMLRLGRSAVEVELTTLMMIDSLDMTDADRAAALAQAIPGKTIVLTGAMVPYAFGSSDGLFNLGSALSFAQVLPTGVFIAMNGTAFPANQAKKNKKSGMFESI